MPLLPIKLVKIKATITPSVGWGVKKMYFLGWLQGCSLYFIRLIKKKKKRPIT